MESASFNLQHQLQELQLAEYCTSATQWYQSDYKSSTDHVWNPSSIYSGISSTNSYLTDQIAITNSSKESCPNKYTMIDSLLVTSSSPGQDYFSFYDGNSFPQQSESANTDLLLPTIKDETSNAFRRLNEMISTHSNTVSGQSHSLSSAVKEPHHHIITGQVHPDVELFYNSKSPDTNGGLSLSNRYSNNFGHVFPSSSMPTLDLSSSSISSPFSCSLGLNLQTLDLFTSTSPGGSSGQQSSYDVFGLSNEKSISKRHNNMQGSHPANRPNKISEFLGGVPRTKRSSSYSEPKESHAEAKKPRSSCPPLKVRKEKLGDRIAALQRLVAPFGKTDTASVLTEAIGYVQFLQDQIQTLSVPYMKPTHRKPVRIVQSGSQEGEDCVKSERDLRSRGLCLVPLSYASYINGCA
ncbi:Transcription factor protein [Quillaja saponaria]|uniref:Transcription factor protein n=1 Tax=Quillaja saponaria TaxID=32244 RepID=A0AAD7P743_QUISA|nr:Transcription factor protein [Quillaja saponaria]